MRVNSKSAVSLIVLAMLSLVACTDEKSNKITSTDCWVGYINGERGDAVRSAPGIIGFGGWAADSTTGSAPENMAVKLTDSSGKSYLFNAPQRVSRPDVVESTKKSGYLMSGFDFGVNGTSLVKGEYGISIEMYPEKKVVSCAIAKKLTIE
jgi:hypothetical protein